MKGWGLASLASSEVILFPGKQRVEIEDVLCTVGRPYETSFLSKGQIAGMRSTTQNAHNGARDIRTTPYSAQLSFPEPPQRR